VAAPPFHGVECAVQVADEDFFPVNIERLDPARRDVGDCRDFLFHLSFLQDEDRFQVASSRFQVES